MRGIALRVSGILGLVMLLIALTPSPAYALIDYPDSDPEIIQINAYRNVLEDDDFLVVLYENTPYETAPSVVYSEAFVWRLYDTDGTTELAQASGYNYNSRGYGYNVISWYFSADDLADLDIDSYPAYYEQPYVIKVSGTFGADTFLIPETHTFNMAESDYSNLTDSDEVKTAIAQRIITIATDLDNQWGLSTDYSLIYSSETGNTLSIYGQSFFRGAIYGVQAMAPSIFPLAISNVNTADRTWDTEYVTELEAQYAGTYFEDAFTAGEEFFDIDYNFMGILIILVISGLIIFSNWYVGGGNLWKNGMIDSAGIVVIGGRLALFPLGELGLLAALCWLYISAKTWRVI